MEIIFTCDKCSQRLSADVSQVGYCFACPNCKEDVTVPNTISTTESIDIPAPSPPTPEVPTQGKRDLPPVPKRPIANPQLPPVPGAKPPPLAKPVSEPANKENVEPLVILSSCDSCNSVYQLPSELLGRLVRCKSCRSEFTVRQKMFKNPNPQKV